MMATHKTMSDGCDPADGMASLAPLVWETATDRLVLSPADGARVMSWRHGDGPELVSPQQGQDGGLLRVLLAEERFPGYSYGTPHLVMSQTAAATGFQAHLRYIWHTPNVFARLFGWTDKCGTRYLDGLLLDKIVTFDAPRSVLTVDMTISNLNADERRITPWLQHTFSGWAHRGFVVRDGRREAYDPAGGWWDGHATGSAASIRLVHCDADEKLFMVLGGHGPSLGGVMKYDADVFAPAAEMATGELRYHPVRIPGHGCWRSTAFLAVTDDGRRWADESPIELRGQTLATSDPQFNERDLLPTLDAWALPEERQRGVMVLTHLDKVPFATPGRFAPAHLLGGFHAVDQRARASLLLIGLRRVPGISVELSGHSDWRLLLDDGTMAPGQLDLEGRQLLRLTVDAPLDLCGRRDIALRLTDAHGDIAVLRVPGDMTVTESYPYDFKQMANYLDERYADEKGIFHGSAEDFWSWQRSLRDRYKQWMRASVIGECPLEPRLLERQVGPTCVRDKMAIQTEPGMWIPSYVVYPREAPPRMSAIMLFHGSGPGKDCYAPDEDPETAPVQTGHELFYMPYRLAQQLRCLVYVPDQRCQGEWGEGFSGEGAARTGFDTWAMRMWDHIRAIDYLCSRPDVDDGKIGCLGSSGGGSATMYTAGIDERVGAAILSSMPPVLVQLPDQFYNDMWSDGGPGDLSSLASAPSMTSNVCALTIPRPLWIMDGKDDRGFGRSESLGEEMHKWQPARDDTARLYALAGASDRFRQSWFDGGHCAGMTVANAVEWFGTWGFQK